MMDIGDAAGDRILDRDHGERGVAAFDHGKRVLEGRASERLQGRIGVATGKMRIGAALALIGDLVTLGCGHGGDAQMEREAGIEAKISRARARSAGVSTPSGTVSTRATWMRNPASNARSCSSRSRISSGDGGKRTKRSRAARR